MKIELSNIREGIADELDKIVHVVTDHGQCQTVYHQADARNRLMSLTGPIRIVTIESKADAQLAWVAERLSPVEQNYGTGGRGGFTADVKLLLLSKSAGTLGAVLKTLSGVYDIQVQNVDMDTLRVLREGWQVEVGKDKGYDPKLMAWAVRCRMGGVKLISDC